MLDEVHNKLSIAMKKHEFSCLPANAIGLPINLIAILNETTLNIDLFVNVYIGKVMFEENIEKQLVRVTNPINNLDSYIKLRDDLVVYYVDPYNFKKPEFVLITNHDKTKPNSIFSLCLQSYLQLYKFENNKNASEL